MIEKQSNPFDWMWQEGSSVGKQGLQALLFGTKYGVAASLLAPLLLGYGVGKLRRKAKNDSVPTAEEFQREMLMNKYDKAILSVSDKRKLLERQNVIDVPPAASPFTDDNYNG